MNGNQHQHISEFRDFHKSSHDACGIVSSIEKKKTPTYENVRRCIDALITLDHRAGFINGEGDGAGVHTDIPRDLWKEKLTEAGMDAKLVDTHSFIVGHIFHQPTPSSSFQIEEYFKQKGIELLYANTKVTNSSALGPIALQEDPTFYQIAFLFPTELSLRQIDQQLFDLTVELERNEGIHVASLSPDYVVYKAMGSGETLLHYYQDLINPLMASTMTLGHNRYSTNTLSNFSRVQPFSILGHNGEINTISKLREEAKMIDVPLVQNGSDSQDMNRTIETLIARDGLSLFQAVDMIFPPIINEIKKYPTHLQDYYTYLRETWGHFAQGPAGIISRFRDEAVYSVDSLGLRPLWMVETETSYVFSSEPGVIPLVDNVAEPRPLSPGEKVGLKWQGDTIQVYTSRDFQEENYTRFSAIINVQHYHEHLSLPEFDSVKIYEDQTIENHHYTAFGWEREHVQLIEQMADKGAEPIRSLGHDSPLAAMNPSRKNIPDFLKESVAVVTNPAIDRDRESEHFSTRTVLGMRPSYKHAHKRTILVELFSPILIEGTVGHSLSKTLEQPSFDQVASYFQKHSLLCTLSLTFTEDESILDALKRLSLEAIRLVEEGNSIIVLDDGRSHREGQLWLDPHLALSFIDQELSAAGLRRSCSLVLRSASLRNLHDTIVALGLGADAVSPYYMFSSVIENNETEKAKNLFHALNKGLEKVISTIGIHELRGYDRLFSAIGLHSEVASLLNIVNFFGDRDLAYDLDAMKQDAISRSKDYHDEKVRLGKSFSLFPRLWKSIGDVARSGDYSPLREKIEELESKNPTALRHLTSLKESPDKKKLLRVDLSVGDHSLPFIIASMSFGSQNEIAFRAYAEAAERLNMVSLNGEGGEIKDMIGQYPKTRGQQVASGRFGVNAELLNSSNLLEIKIGQGAKPGEGGHLPGSKVTAKIAEARNATIGSDLISPSNNHDIYSIEDLAQMIHELKTANDEAKVAVKVPVVPNIGTIAVGIAKAGADVITLSGFDGGTGAARIHALQHVGLPVEVGVKAAHNALLEAGLRDTVELWADGGIKSALDVIKVMLLGANRIGFGTLSMIAIGCTTCRGCHLDTCHVGIATQIESEAQAKEHGLRRFVPRQSDLAVQGLVNLFTAFGEELKELTSSLGVTRLQDIVGKSDLLVQTKGLEQVNLTKLLAVLDLPQFQSVKELNEAALTTAATAAGAEYLDGHLHELFHSRTFSRINSTQRVLGSRVSGRLVKGRLGGTETTSKSIHLMYGEGSVPGNGLGAYNSDGISILVHGGGQDGIGKTSFGGSIAVLKGQGSNGNYYNGSVGKGFGYGAQKGLLVAQGNADSRAGIRLSGADMIIGGLVTTPIPEKETGNIGTYSNIKGFAFEYMTNGRGLVLGDPGPWICAGMTGGVIYLRVQPEMGLTREALERRIAKGAKVTLGNLNKQGIADVTELLSTYHSLLASDHQEDAAYVQNLLQHPEKHFLQVVPVKEQADPTISTE
ncbi:glutamate synthase [Bacillus coahuilensis m2-6]|uniref:glutamate synthase-related protein n=1 Tax=Bacillus coahuilensis TaxID=408580 RepID=UPI0007505A03|nr:glutamate synthase-related protein [Bacillus coahuilensis]KUP09630.1 glutamate synthase [Bacillus coahuilensis m2-6]